MAALSYFPSVGLFSHDVEKEGRLQSAEFGPLQRGLAPCRAGGFNVPVQLGVSGSRAGSPQEGKELEKNVE